jgi:multidrug resistance efflux pump
MTEIAPTRVQNPLRLLPLSQALDTIEALELESGPGHGRVGGVLLATLIAGLLGLPWLEVDEVARVSGWIRACTEHQDLRSPSSGRVVATPATEGGWVEAGAVVLALEDPALGQRLRESDQRLERVRREAEEWAALARGEEELHRGVGLEEPKTEWGRRLWAERRTADDVLGLAEDKARRDLRRVETLVARGLVSVRDHDDLRHEADLRAAARHGARERAVAEWRERQRDAEERLATERARRSELAEAERQLTVRAPVGGHLIGFRSRAAGSWIMAGEHLATLSPGDGLKVEARVPGRVAARLAPGQPARIAVEGLPPTEWGRLGGHVESVSADVLDDRVGGYRVVIVPEADSLRSGRGLLAPVAKGNRADVRVAVGRVSLARLLVRSAGDWVDRAAAHPASGTEPIPFPPNPAVTIGGPGVNPEGEPKP